MSDSLPVVDKMAAAEAERQEEARRNAAVFMNSMMNDDIQVVFNDQGHKDEAGPSELEEPELPRVRMKRIKIDENCVHEVALLSSSPYCPLVENLSPLAKKFPFPLDPFQKTAILCVENNQSVLVSAHTSAGKTVVALYAIAQCFRDKKKVIYTSPIKALSNQKYRELEEEFGNVGLMTGDANVNPSASCIVMTTEILRSMLYNGSDLLRDVGWIIFDEVHYLKDKERGTVWEETIILLPNHINQIFLSATIRNPQQFARWICNLHDKPCHIVSTDYRPVPLYQFVYPTGGEGLYEMVDTKGTFIYESVEKAMEVIAKGQTKIGSIKNKRKTAREADFVKIVRTMKVNNMMPCLAFSFSKKECESLAITLKDMDFNSENEKMMVAEYYNTAIDSLSDSDKKLLQISSVFNLLKRGIGVHHSGLLPVIKETTEILFSLGLIKILIATETFAMGLNMPARTVLFTSSHKFDGKDFRLLTSGEYIQMSGRAGRRGVDKLGVVILMLDQLMTKVEAMDLIAGKADVLCSQFRPSYNMILNLLRSNVNPQIVFERSFKRFQSVESIEEILRKEMTQQDVIRNWVVDSERDAASYFELEEEIAELEKALTSIQFLPIHCIPFVAPGRLVHIVIDTDDYGWAAIVNFHKQPDTVDPNTKLYVIQIVVYVNAEYEAKRQAKPVRGVEKGKWVIMLTPLSSIRQMSCIRIQLPRTIQKESELACVGALIMGAGDRYLGFLRLPVLDPVTHMHIADDVFKSNYNKLKNKKKQFENHNLRRNPCFTKILEDYNYKKYAEKSLATIRESLDEIEDSEELQKLKQMKKVLRLLQYCDETDQLEAKGRIACELSTLDNLILTEMLFSGVFNNLSYGQVAALLSCFVFDEKNETDDAPKRAAALSDCFNKIKEYARKISKVSNECGLEISEDEYIEKINPGLMDVIHSWVEEQKFGYIMKNTGVYEGTIIRCLRRIDEVLVEMMSATRTMGNGDLETKLKNTRERIRRDIVFTPSLYHI